MMMKCVGNLLSVVSLKSSRINGILSNVNAMVLLKTTDIGVRYAGHSKWQNIKHTKAAKDLQKNQLYNRHIEEIKISVRDGKSVNPKNNIKLAKCLENARKEGVATATITRVLQKLEKVMSNPKPVLFEYRGSNGVLVIISTNTDNKNRTRSEINYITKRHGLVKTDNIASAFDHRGFVYAKPPPDVENADEKALDDAIEIGAEEVQRDEERPDLLVFSCDPSLCNTIRSKLEGRRYQIEDAEDLYLPRTVVELEEKEAKVFYDAFEKIDEIPEVNAIFTNLT